MNKIFRVLAECLLFVTLVFAGCTKDDTTIPDGSDPRSKLVGTWTCSETQLKKSPKVTTYQVTVKIDSSNSTQILIQNFAYIGDDEPPPYAIMAGSTFTMPTQNVCSNTMTVKGSGALVSDTKMTWSYETNDGADLIKYTAVMMKN